ncbi:UNVERIFIED_CONTAM: hypothetical protein K2H54_064929 [Gekko kuhli]
MFHCIKKKNPTILGSFLFEKELGNNSVGARKLKKDGKPCAVTLKTANSIYFRTPSLTTSICFSASSEHESMTQFKDTESHCSSKLGFLDTQHLYKKKGSGNGTLFSILILWKLKHPDCKMCSLS